MDFSDDSFAWCTASSSSEDSSSENMTINPGKDDCDGESESGKKYKKKLQKELFNANKVRHESQGLDNDIRHSESHDHSDTSDTVEKFKIDSESEYKKKKKKKKKEKKNDSLLDNVTEVIVENGNSQMEDDSDTERLHIQQKQETRVQPKDKIEVDDDDDPGTPEDLNSSKLKRYLRSNSHLKPISVIKHEINSLVSKEDDLWILNCPHEIDIALLENVDITVDDKCKMKINSQTYDGTLNTDINNVALLTFKEKKPIIKNVAIKGTVNLRKKIPKPHFVQDNVMVNNQTNFIPLPDTKCRHPLFGPDYKRAIKIPTAVKARLKVADEVETEDVIKSEKKKKKKHKKEKRETIEFESEVPRKKRKHHQTDEDEPAPKKSKKIKQDPDKVWESEKAIEENLFNF